MIISDEESFERHIVRTLNPKKPRTWKQTIKDYYNYQKQRVKRDSYSSKGILVVWTFEEFELWMENNKEKFEYIKSVGHTPSIDRIDASKHYEESNCRMIPNELNSAMGEITALQNRLKHLYEYCSANSFWLS